MSCCSICLESRTHPCCCVPCGHVFCKDCIESWAENTRECPDCRRRIDSLQIIFGMEERRHDPDESENQPTGYISSFPLRHRILLEKYWMFVLIGIIMVAFLFFMDLNSSSSYITAIPSAILSVLWDIIVFIVSLLFQLLKFPFQFLSNIDSYCDSFSSAMHHLFWFLIYVFIIVFVVWYCINTVKVTKARKEWKEWRKKRR